MRIPALALAVAFSGGILLGRQLQVTPDVLRLSLTGVIFLLICAALFVWCDSLRAAAIFSLLSWICLGALAILLTSGPLPAEHVLSRIAAGQIELKTPLRWYGRLRSEPSRLPWGFELELELAGVETAQGTIPVVGGMRVSFTPKDSDPSLPEVHAGDEVSVLTQARLPQVFRDAGAFDRRAYLAQQNIHLLATLRASSLLERIASPPPTAATRLARFRALLRKRLDSLYPNAPEKAGILRAMLLGDRSFVDHAESVNFQKTGVFHVLVVAGLHVGALSFFLFWLARKLRLPPLARTLFVLAALLAYVIVVEQRAPVLRAGLMAAVVILGSFFYRRLELLNSAAIAVLVLLVANPQFVSDTGFLLSFLAIGTIAGMALPLIERHLQPSMRALENWRDVTRDASHPAAQVQFRLDFRDAVFALTARLRGRYAAWGQELGATGARVSLRLTELFILSFLLQLGMLPLMAGDFHRVSLLGPLANLFAVPLTGVIVPLGFFSLATAIVFPSAALLLAHPLAWLVLLQGRIVSFFAAIPHGSYRIPEPPTWVTWFFFLVAILAVARLRAGRTLRRWEWCLLAVLLMLMAGVIATYPFRPSVTTGNLEVTVLDVGQGDSILVVSPKGSTLLIDGGGAFEGFRGREEHLGPDPGEEAVSAYLWSRGLQKLDAVALTHGHQDHVGGLTAVFQNFRVSRLFLGRETAAPSFLKLKQLATEL